MEGWAHLNRVSGWKEEGESQVVLTRGWTGERCPTAAAGMHRSSGSTRAEWDRVLAASFRPTLGRLENGRLMGDGGGRRGGGESGFYTKSPIPSPQPGQTAGNAGIAQHMARHAPFHGQGGRAGVLFAGHWPSLPVRAVRSVWFVRLVTDWGGKQRHGQPVVPGSGMRGISCRG